jgi:hypothetical protein
MGAWLIRRDSAGGIRSRTLYVCRLACAGTIDSGWKHFMRQLPISGQGFTHPEQGWSQGISSELAEMAAMSDLAVTSEIPAGMATSAIAMARTPRATNQRCNDLFTT